VDFGMNTMCAAGTGAFLNQLAARLRIPIERLGALALQSTQEVAIAGRCTFFAESDLVFKQQVGYPINDIVWGFCKSMVRNYLNDVGKGKRIEAPIFFQGGVAANVGIRRAFKEALRMDVDVPEHHVEMGAYGAAMIARRSLKASKRPTRMRSVEEIIDCDFITRSFMCHECANHCEIILFQEGRQRGNVGWIEDKWLTKSDKGYILQQ
jgi:activator of 2-hydroxyglutaryl-CoA dehydratase